MIFDSIVAADEANRGNPPSPAVKSYMCSDKTVSPHFISAELVRPSSKNPFPTYKNRETNPRSVESKDTAGRNPSGTQDASATAFPRSTKIRISKSNKGTSDAIRRKAFSNTNPSRPTRPQPDLNAPAAPRVKQ
jgi:hypothetical protein